MKTKLPHYLGILALLLIFSCGGDDNPGPATSPVESTGEATLQALSETCSSFSISGTYNMNEALTSSNYVSVEINVTKTGSYTVVTDTVNGYSFKGTGNFTKTGSQHITLAGSGTPLLSGNNTLTITFGTSSCKISISVKDNTDYSQRIILATGQTHMASSYTFYAFNGNKQILWTKAGFSGIPAVHNGVAYLSLQGNLQAVNILTGNILWENTTGSSFSNAIAYHDSTLYISGSNGYIYGVNAGTGKEIWNYFSGSYGVISSSPTVVNNVIYVGGNGGKLFALNTNGTQKWVHQIQGITSSVRSSPAVNNNTVYFGNDNGYVYAINATDGSYLWKTSVGVNGEQSPAVADNKLYIQGDEKLYCLNATDGQIVWEYVSGKDNDWSSPKVHNGIVYASGMGDGLQAFNATTGQKLWSNYSSAQTADMDPVVFNNMVYITGPGGISAVNATSGGTLWNYGYLDASKPVSQIVVYYTPAVVYDKVTKEVAYPSTSGNVQ